MNQNPIANALRALLAPFALAAATLVSASSVSESACAQAPIAECAGIPATIFVNADGFVVGGPLNGKRFTGRLTGTPGPDVILGTSGADIIAGGGGDDLICGLGGRDTISGGTGDDLIDGGGGADVMNGGAGSDTARKVQAGDKRVACEVNAAIPPLAIAIAAPANPVTSLEGALAEIRLDVDFANVHAGFVSNLEIEVVPSNGGLVLSGTPGQMSVTSDDFFTRFLAFNANLAGDYTVRVRAVVPGSSVVDEVEIPVTVDANDGDATITLSQGTSDFVLEAGEVRNITYVVTFDDVSGPATATFTQSVVGDAGGLLIDSDAPAEIAFNSTRSFVFNTVATGVLPGAYGIETLVTITTSGTTAAKSLGATIVLPGTSVEEVFVPTFDPPAAKENVATPLLVRAAFSTTGAAPVALQVQEVDAGGAFLADLGVLLDSGVAPDEVAGDGIYTGNAELDARPEGALFAIVRAPSGAVSGSGRLLISPFDEGAKPSDPAKLLEIAPGVQVFGEEIVVRFAPGTPSATVSAAAALVGGSVRGMLSSIDTYQFALPGADTAVELEAAKATLAALPEVASAQLNTTATLDDFPPDGSPTWFFDTRLNEARVVASGSGLIVAVVDTGIDALHPDLAGRVIPGKDLTTDPATSTTVDTNGHGTSVSGVVAGIRDGAGVIGASAARVIPFKATDGANGSALTMANALLYASHSSARIISISMHLSEDYDPLDQAVRSAAANGKLIVASAGNDGSSAAVFPCAYPTVLCVGATDGEAIAGFSNRGPQVDIAAPGVDIPVATPGNGFDSASGTSFSTPMVSGIAALVWSRQPGLTPDELIDHLKQTASPIEETGVGAGIVDAFNAVFNGGFESLNLKPWAFAGTVGSILSLGEITPREGDRMCMATTGPAGDQVAASMQQSFTIQTGVPDPLVISLQFAFVTEEFPEFVGTQFDDDVRIVLVSSGGQEFELGVASVNGSSFLPLSGVDFPGGDNTVGWTGWLSGQATIPNAGGQTFRIEVRDAGDDVFDSAVMIDDIRFQ